MNQEMIRAQTLIDRFVELLREKPEVDGIVLLGGLGRHRHWDSYSDVDVGVFLELGVSVPEWLPPFEFEVDSGDEAGGADTLVFNLHQHDISAEQSVLWPADKKEAYANAIVVFDRCGRTRALIDKQVTWNEDACRQSLVETAARLLGLSRITPQRQAKRGLYVDAHYALNVALDLIVDAIYKLNREHASHSKWRMSRAAALRWLPPGFVENLTSATMIMSMTAADVDRRVELIDAIATLLIAKITEYLGTTDVYDLACRTVLRRQLVEVPFADRVLRKLATQRTLDEHSRMRGFISYHLIGGVDELRALLERPSPHALYGVGENRRALMTIVDGA